MNILIDTLPTTVLIGGAQFGINADFRTSILFELLMQERDIDDVTRHDLALNLYYSFEEDAEMPSDVAEASEQIAWFFRCGQPEPKSGKGRGAKQIYSFEHDAPYIYAAFRSQYGIDLQDVENLHWWKFRAMFNALDHNCELRKIMDIRAVDLKDIKDKSERQRMRKLKAAYQLPDMRSAEQKESDFANALF